MKKALKIIAIILGVIIVGFGILIWYFKSVISADTIAEYIHDHPENSSIYLTVNNQVLADKNSDRKMPLASSVKIIVAIEYAQQVADSIVNPNTMVDTNIINRYYIPNTDGGAQPEWIKSQIAQNKIADSKVSIEQIAKGMIDFSSNANTEYLIDLLTVDSLNKRIEKLGIQTHDSFYYFISALYVLKDNNIEQLEAMPMSTYQNKSLAFHLRKSINDTSLKISGADLPLEKQRIWSDRLIGSTTKDYASVMQKINSRTYFDSTTQHYLDHVLEGLMDNPANQKWLEHSGKKGGSTAFVLTENLYATRKDGEQIELSYFFNNLDIVDAIMMQSCINMFDLAMIRNKDGERDKLLEIINEK